MPKRSSKKKLLADRKRRAKAVVDQATANEQAKNAAALLGRLGGLKGGKARAAKLSKEQRIEIASNAARARWRSKRKNDDTPT